MKRPVRFARPADSDSAPIASPPLSDETSISRRQWLRRSSTASLAGLAALGAAPSRLLSAEPRKKAQIAITLDLEMCRNFPQWEDEQWDYEKGNLTAETKRYAVEAGRRVRERGGRVHYFCVGRVLEQADVSWLVELAEAGHPIGNHTYDHVNFLAEQPDQIQYRFQRAPWLIQDRTVAEVLRENVRLTTVALKQRAGIENRGFRTPGGFTKGLQGREDLQNMLKEAGFTWISSQYPNHDNTKPKEQPTDEVYQNIVNAQEAAQPFRYPTGLIEIPMSPISDIGAFRTGRWRLEWFLEALHRAITWTIEHHAVFDFLAHPACLSAVDPKFQTLELICDLVEKSAGRAELVDLDAIAEKVAG